MFPEDLRDIIEAFIVALFAKWDRFVDIWQILKIYRRVSWIFPFFTLNVVFEIDHSW